MLCVAKATAGAVSPIRPSTEAATRTATKLLAVGRNKRAISTRITDLFGCEHPLLLPGMSWISTPPLVAAVSNAGGLGILATGPLSADETRASIREIRRLTNKPFGVGATLLMPGASENARVALQEEVPVLNISLGRADWIRDRLDAYGGKLLSTVTNHKHAESAVASGADALMVTGHEAAAHGGAVTSLVLIPSLAEALPSVPIVAAGGFATGRGLNAALSLGADAIAMGTRLAVTEESPLASRMKEAIVEASETQTIYGKNFDGIHARVLQTPIAEQLMGSRPWLPVVAARALAASRQMGIPLWKVLPGLWTNFSQIFAIAQFGAATEAIRAATISGDAERGVQFVGQCQGLIRDVPTVEELVCRVLEESAIAHEEQVQKFRRDDSFSGTHGGGSETRTAV